MRDGLRSFLMASESVLFRQEVSGFYGEWTRGLCHGQLE